MKYRADIDGLRAVAIIPVVLYHTQFKLFSGGFVGVDIFFVISGYLITSLILEEIKEGRFTIAHFYERRIRRIFPAFFTVLLATAAIAALIMFPGDFEQFGKSIVAATLFAANFFFWTKTEYFAAGAETKPLLHTWSLSVEEQFYLIFPLILLISYKYFQGRWKSFLIPAAFLSLLLSIWGMHSFPTATFFLFPGRAWELLLGSFLALNLFPPIAKQWQREGYSLIGIALILWAVFQFSHLTPFPGAYALVPCVGALLIIYAGRDGPSLIGRLLSTPPLVFIGLISYSLYLWHWPIMVFSRQYFYERYSDWHTAGILAISLLLSVISWRYIERPFRKKGSGKSRKKLFAVAATVMTLFIAAGSAIDINEGWPARFGDDLVTFSYDLSQYKSGTCFLDEQQHYSEWRGESCFLQTGHDSNTLLWGDSFAAHYVPGIMANLDKIGSNILLYSAGGCAPSLSYDPVYRTQCKEFSAQIQTLLSQYHISTVILVAGWDLALQNGMSYGGLEDTIELLQKKGITVFLIGQSPRFERSVQDIFNISSANRRIASKSTIGVDIQTINEKLRTLVEPGNFIDPSALFCSGQVCRFKDKQDFFFWDDGHMTTYGSEKAAEYIFSQINI